METPAPERPHCCPVCSRCFETKGSLTQHTRSKHSAPIAASDVVRCPYCDAAAVFLASSAPIYGRDHGPMWACMPCEAWVGVHPGTRTPLGRLANKQLRTAKIAAHAAFDPIWKRGHASRGTAYEELAQRLGIARKDCHIGHFDVATCLRVVEICRTLAPELQARSRSAA